MSVPEDDGRPDLAALALQNVHVAIKGLGAGASPGHVATAVGVAQTYASLELAHQVARVAAALERQERTARGRPQVD